MYHLLSSVRGIGKILALVLLYEIQDIRRFPSCGQFLSYARLVRCPKESAGKIVGKSNKKIGNSYLRWAFGEAAVLFLKGNPRRNSGFRNRPAGTARARPWRYWQRNSDRRCMRC